MKTKMLKLKKKSDEKSLDHSQGQVDCNICGHPYRPHSHYDRFCNSCRNHSKLFTFSEWMPETGVSL